MGAISAKAEDDGLRGSGGLTFVAKLRARPQVLSIKRMRAARAEHAVREATRRTSKWKGLGAFFVRTGAARMSICLGQDLHAKRSADEAHRNVNGAVLTVEEGKEKSVPFWQQGDLDMYTEANLAKRYKLRHSPEVLEVLQMWWACAQRSMQSEKLEGTVLARDDYVRICTKIYKAMIDNFDAAEAAEAAEQDWLQDSKGETELSRESFLDAMFELADVWTRTIEPEEYAAFMRDLFGYVASRQDGTDYFWKADADIAYGGYVLEDEGEGEGEGEGGEKGGEEGEKAELTEEAPSKTRKAAPPGRLTPTPPPKSPPSKSSPPKSSPPKSSPPKSPPPKSPPAKPRDRLSLTPPKFERPALPPVGLPKKATRPPPQPSVARKPMQQRRDYVDWGSGPEAPRRQHGDSVWRPGGSSEERAHRAMDWGDKEEAARKEWIYSELERKRPPQGGLPALIPLTELSRDQSSTWQQLRSRMVQRPEAAREQWDGLKEAALAGAMAASASSPALLASQELPPTLPPVTDPALTAAPVPAPVPAPESAYVPAPAAASHPAMVEPLPPSPPAANGSSRAAVTTGMAFNAPRAAPKVLRGPRVNAAVQYVGRSSPVNSTAQNTPHGRPAPRSDAMAAFGGFSAMRVR